MPESVLPRTELAFLLAATATGLTTAVAEVVAASPPMTVAILGLATICCSVLLLAPAWLLAHAAGALLGSWPLRRRPFLGLATLAVALLLAALCASGHSKPYVSAFPIVAPAGTGLAFLTAFVFLLPGVSRHRLRGKVLAATIAIIVAWSGAFVLSILSLNADPVMRFRAFERALLLGPQIRILDGSLGLLSPTLADVPPATREALEPLRPVPLLDPSDPWQHPNVLLITVDALRGDTIPPPSGSPLRAPNMAGLATRGIRFSRAYCSACMTAHSVPAFLMGKYGGQLTLRYVRVGDDLVVDPTDSAIRVLDRRKVGLVPVADRSLTLAAVLARGGYQTATVIAYVMLVPQAGITRDFEIVDDALLRAGGTPGDRVSTPDMTGRAVEVIRHRDRSRPLFFWMHYLDPHEPYLGSPVGDGDREYNRYLGEIETVDRGLGTLLDAVAREGMADNTVLILTSDHGEAFGEHGGEVHGRRLYEENVHVPLIIVPPARARVPARVVAVPVRGVDLAPTIADLAGVPFPSDLAGRSLAPTILRGEAPTLRPVLIECFRYGGESRSLLSGSLKLIDNARSGVLEFYDLANDPHERHNLIGERQGDAAALMGLLRGAEALLALRPLPRPHATSSNPVPVGEQADE
ncbi:MAG: sulfatase [Deltaproteobacteria bacterium]|nr:sulfatase [Deltaproteobacteria bacterium]